MGTKHKLSSGQFCSYICRIFEVYACYITNYRKLSAMEVLGHG